MDSEERILNRKSEIILWGDEILADIPSCLGGEEHRINRV
jgi:hypothetical protein